MLFTFKIIKKSGTYGSAGHHHNKRLIFAIYASIFVFTPILQGGAKVTITGAQAHKPHLHGDFQYEKNQVLL